MSELQDALREKLARARDDLEPELIEVRRNFHREPELRFEEQPAVINGASDLLQEIFGDAGVHARTAIGVQSLPSGAPVEIELVASLNT